MGDIGGVRCIFYNEGEVYKNKRTYWKEFLKPEEELEIILRKLNETLVTKAYTYVKDPVSDKRIEIQLRTIEHHNWATLIEITDLLYDLRFKRSWI